MSEWQVLGKVSPAHLRPAREQAHWALQVLSAAGETFAEHVPDTSHTASQWDAALSAFVGQRLGGARIGLRAADLTLLVLRDDERPAATLPLAGRTLAEAYAWAGRALSADGRSELGLVHPGYELPSHPIADGGRFEAAAGLDELARWYANADAVLRRFERETPGAGSVLCWPHHFDIASLVAVETDNEGAALRTVGVGFSPGDEFVPQPYWYVNHGPETARSELPPLAAGEWVSEDWIGAILRGEALIAVGDAAAQHALLERFLGSAVRESRELVLEARLDR
jgi:hypothetical protein